MGRWGWGGLAAAGLALLAVLAPALAQEEAAAQRIDGATFLLSDAPVSPPASDAWVPQRLPDSWRESRPGVHGLGWYRLQVRLPEGTPPRGLHAVYLPVVNSAFALWVNGVQVADSGGLDGPMAVRSAGFPQWATVPPQVLRPGTNELMLRLRVAPNLRGGLAAPFFGPQEALRARYDRDQLRRVAIPRTLNAAVLALGLLVLLLWSRNRAQQAAHGWCGAFMVVSALWSLRNFDLALSLPEVSSRAWEAFVLGTLASARLMLLMFVLRFCGLRWPRTERIAIAAMVLLPLVLYAGGEGFMSAIRTLFYNLCGVPMWVSLWLLARHAWRHRSREALAVFVALVIGEILAVHDYLVAIDWLPFGTTRWQDYAAAVLAVGLVGALAGRYFAAFATARQLNLELEERVRVKAQELEVSMRKVAAFELDAALSGERQRLMRDMHDGIGSQLITMTGALERGSMQAPEVARLLRECIDDLRLVIDSLEPEQEGLSAALANLRYRFATRLESAGLAMAWDMDGLPQDWRWPPGGVLQVLRIVQEALTNVLRHSGARHAWLAARTEGDVLVITLRDDGNGQPPVRAGRGLANMKQRAQLLGGTFEAKFGGAQGTELELRLPHRA